MCYSTSPQSQLHFSLRIYRFIAYFVATVSCFVLIQIFQNIIASAQASTALSSNAGKTELSQSFSNTSFEITPLSIICVVILVMVLLFLLQPIYVYFYQSSNSTAIIPTTLPNTPISLDQKSKDQKSNKTALHDLKPHQFPSIDRLIFTDQSIISKTLHSLESVSEVQLLPLSAQALIYVIEQSMAEVIVLMDNNIRLDSLDMTLGIRHLWDQNLDVVKPESLSPEIVEKRVDQDSKIFYPDLYQFLNTMLCARNSTSSAPYHGSSGRNELSPSHNHKCYIVRRSVLFSLLKRWEWSHIESKYQNDQVKVERLYTVIGLP